MGTAMPGSSASPHTPISSRLFFYPSSPIQTHMRASALKRTLPSSLNVEFYTVDPSPSSPTTAEDISKLTGRLVLATKGTTGSKADVNPQIEGIEDAVLKGVSTQVLKDVSNLKVVCAGLLKCQENLSKSHAELVKNLSKSHAELVKEQECLSRSHAELLKEHEELQKEQGCLSKAHEELLKEQAKLQEQLEFYCGSRKHAATGLVGLLLVLLDNEVRRSLHNASVYEGLDVSNLFVGFEECRPFNNVSDITYTRCYWWYLHYYELQLGMRFEDLWKGKLGYEDVSRELPQPQQWKLTRESRIMAEKLLHLMEVAEMSVLSYLQQGSASLKAVDLRNACGLYIFSLRPLENEDDHLWEKAFNVSFDQQSHHSRGGRNRDASMWFVFNSLHLILNDKFKERAVAVLTDILANCNSLGQIACIKDVVVDVARLLKACAEGTMSYPSADVEFGLYWSFRYNCFMHTRDDSTI